MPVTKSKLATIAFCVAYSGCMRNARLRPYAGQWLVAQSGKNLFVLNTSVHRGRVTGSLSGPAHYTEDANYHFSGISLPVLTEPLAGRLKRGIVETVVGKKPDRWREPITLDGRNYLLLHVFNGQVPPLRFERVPIKPKIAAATDWPEYSLTPEIVAIRQQLDTLAKDDKAVREKAVIDERETERLSEQATPILESIFASYGWPRISVFGTQASNNFWLLVQHQSLPVQKGMLDALRKAVDAGEAVMWNYAYLFDRIAISEGRPQRWGTQSRCENKRAILYPIDDASLIEQRRREIGLRSLAESIEESTRVCGHVVK